MRVNFFKLIFSFFILFFIMNCADNDNSKNTAGNREAVKSNDKPNDSNIKGDQRWIIFGADNEKSKWDSYFGELTKKNHVSYSWLDASNENNFINFNDLTSIKKGLVNNEHKFDVLMFSAATVKFAEWTSENIRQLSKFVKPDGVMYIPEEFGFFKLLPVNKLGVSDNIKYFNTTPYSFAIDEILHMLESNRFTVGMASMPFRVIGTGQKFRAPFKDIVTCINSSIKCNPALLNKIRYLDRNKILPQFFAKLGIDQMDGDITVNEFLVYLAKIKRYFNMFRISDVCKNLEYIDVNIEKNRSYPHFDKIEKDIREYYKCVVK